MCQHHCHTVSCPNCTKPTSFRAPKQGQPGLAVSNPIRSSTMITKPSDTGCQQTLSRQPYLPDPWLHSHRRGLVHFKIFPLCVSFYFPRLISCNSFRSSISLSGCVCVCAFETHAAHNSYNLWIFFLPFPIVCSLYLLLLRPTVIPPKSPALHPADEWALQLIAVHHIF